jgi:hypothetical protein
MARWFNVGFWLVLCCVVGGALFFRASIVELEPTLARLALTGIVAFTAFQIVAFYTWSHAAIWRSVDYLWVGCATVAVIMQSMSLLVLQSERSMREYTISASTQISDILQRLGATKSACERIQEIPFVARSYVSVFDVVRANINRADLERYFAEANRISGFASERQADCGTFSSTHDILSRQIINQSWIESFIYSNAVLNAEYVGGLSLTERRHIGISDLVEITCKTEIVAYREPDADVTPNELDWLMGTLRTLQLERVSMCLSTMSAQDSILKYAELQKITNSSQFRAISRASGNMGVWYLIVMVFASMRLGRVTVDVRQVLMQNKK